MVLKFPLSSFKLLIHVFNYLEYDDMYDYLLLNSISLANCYVLTLSNESYFCLTNKDLDSNYKIVDSISF